MSKRFFLVCAALVSCGGWGCSDSDDTWAEHYGVSPEYSVTKSALSAVCTMNVKGVGNVDMETDYVPHCIICEIGTSVYPAMQAQAVAARSTGYFFMDVKGSVRNGPEDQVYIDNTYCGVGQYSDAQWNKALQAAADTQGVILRYGDKYVMGFYVSGAKQQYLNADCTYSGNSSSAGWVSPQKYATYNWNKSGDSVQGRLDGEPGYKNYLNRGCMSQNGAMCLGKNGWVWENILRWAYGMDVELVRTEGSCIKHPNCTTTVKDGTVIDDSNECFRRSPSPQWYSLSAGNDGSSQFAYTKSGDADGYGEWTVNVETAGKYEVFAYVDAGHGTRTKKAPYTVRAKGVEKNVKIDLTKTGWVSIGEFDFAAGGDQWIKLTNASGEAFVDANSTRVVFDAIKFTKVNCTNKCSKNGARQCAENGVQTCLDTDGDGCFEWSDVTACENGTTCSNGECISVCKDACVSGEKKCSDDNAGYVTCNVGADGCTAWSAVTPCGENETCTEGLCSASQETTNPPDDKPPAENEPECPESCVENGTRCSGNGYQKCIQDGSCMVWSEVTACADDESCHEGQCLKETVEEDFYADCKTAIDGRPSTIIDDTDACFVRSDSNRWVEMSGYGYKDSLYYAYLQENEGSAVGTWRLNVTKSGKYRIYAYVDVTSGNLADTLDYKVYAGSKAYSPEAELPEKAGWLELGSFSLTAGAKQYVQLSNLAGSGDDVSKRVLYDAIKVVPDEFTDTNEDGGSGNEAPKVHASSDGCSVSGGTGSSPASIWLTLAGFIGLAAIRRRRNAE